MYGVNPVIDSQSLTTALTTVGISVGVMVILGAVFVACSAAWTRYDRTTRVRAVERYLAAVAGRPHPADRARSS